MKKLKLESFKSRSIGRPSQAPRRLEGGSNIPGSTWRPTIDAERMALRFSVKATESGRFAIVEGERIVATFDTLWEANSCLKQAVRDSARDA